MTTIAHSTPIIGPATCDDLMRVAFCGDVEAMKALALECAFDLRASGVERPSELVIYGALWERLQKHSMTTGKYVPALVARLAKPAAQDAARRQHDFEPIATILPRALGPRLEENDV